jgi:hypothetical protein
MMGTQSPCTECDAVDTRPVTSRVEPARDAISTRADSLTRALDIVALVEDAFITVTCLTVQFLRTDLDSTTVSMSSYVKGQYGRWVQASPSCRARHRGAGIG